MGYHLFGESYQRGEFLAKLKEHYQAQGFAVESELPDHVAVMLRFLSMSPDKELNQVLIEEGLIPALEKMAQAFRDGGNPYGLVVGTLLDVLKGAAPDQAEVASPSQKEEGAGPVLGFTSIAAYGSFFFPVLFGWALTSFGSPNIAFYTFFAFYAVCAFLNWWYYTRPGCEKPCKPR